MNKSKELISLIEKVDMSGEIEDWIKQAKINVEKNTKAKWPETPNNWNTLTVTKGPKFYKVWIKNLDSIGRGSIFMFIDKEGNIYKAASTNAPAKGIRGHINSINPKNLDGSIDFLYR